jgi:hypothetical protein
MKHPYLKSFSCVAGLFLGANLTARCDSPALAPAGKTATQPAPGAKPLSAVLPPEKWKKMEGAVDRALAWIASEQANDGSFPSLNTAQPAVTSLCVMAFLSRGHQPGVGPYGQQLDRAIDYVLSCQKSDGLLCHDSPGPYWQFERASHTGSYNHAIAGLMLGEVYGHVTGERAKQLKTAIQKALVFSRALQSRPKMDPEDFGGWKYIRPATPNSDADLSVTAWQLMFLRSARNAEFSVSQKYVEEALDYVRRNWDPQTGMFNYTKSEGGSRGMVGAGILSLSMGGQHQTAMARAAGDWLLAHPYGRLGQSYGTFDRYFYSMYYCSQAAAQLGGHYWEGIYPPIVDAVLNCQEPSGALPPEPNRGDVVFGQCYTTALAVLALTPPYQLLPVYQR